MKDINKIVGSYCKSIFNSVQRQYSGRPNSRSWKNYPAVAVVCTDKSGICSRGTSNKVDGGFYKCTPVLASKLSTLGPIGVPSRFCKNRVAYCAEPHAARGMIIKHSCKLENRVSSLCITAYPLKLSNLWSFMHYNRLRISKYILTGFLWLSH